MEAVIKKGYLTKKGHRLKTWRRRWFILKKTTMRYYESKEKPSLKVNERTHHMYYSSISKVICMYRVKWF